MNFLRLLLLSVLPLALFGASVDSKITAVTIYADRAVITRTATTELGSGITEVVFENLPQQLDDRSLQVSGKGTAVATILDVSAKRAFVDHAANPRAKTLEEELQKLRKESRELDVRTHINAEQLASLSRAESAVFSPPTEKAPRIEINAITAAVAYFTEQKQTLSRDRMNIDEEREALQAKIEAAQRQLNDLRGSGGRAFKTVTVRVSSQQKGSLNVTLAYTVSGASWAPSYDARVSSNEHSLELSYLGLVRQNTGEDWRDVALTLSTARPSLGGSAPKLFPWELTEPEKVTLQSFAVTAAPAPAMAREKTMQFALSAQPDRNAGRAADAVAAQATIEAGATSASFTIATASSVPSDNSPQKIPITTAKLKTEPEYLTVPKNMTTAYLTSKVTNSTDFPFLTGALNIFLDGTFVATSRLETVMPGDKFDLALGADEGISVKHKRVQRFTENTGLTNSGVRVTYEYLLTIQNNKKTTEKVVLHDQVPVSRHEKIVVKVQAPDTRTIKPDNEGKLTWTLDLKPGEKRELPIKFTVEHPRDFPVEGLDN